METNTTTGAAIDAADEQTQKALNFVGNILTGVLLQRFGSFTAVFAATACLYLSSFLVWTLCVRDGPLFVPA